MRKGKGEIEEVGKKQEERKEKCASEKLGALMPHFTALNYHNSYVNGGMENRAGQSWGQHSLEYSISNLYTHSPINYNSHGT